MECIPRKYTTDELVSAWRDGSLKINEEYQRGAEWTLAQRQALIDSIFRKYPIPPIFLHEIRAKGLGGSETIRYEIVDGQQRIRALAEFHSGNFPLLASSDPRLRLPHSLKNILAPWGTRRFSELDQALRKELESKELDVFVIVQVENSDEVRDLFIRLQSGTALTRQQIRDAWPGTVGPFIERLAGKLKRAPSVRLFTQIDRRGTRSEDDSDQYDVDRQFCAQLLCLFLARVRDPLAQQSIGANELDKVYHVNTTFDVDGPGARRFQDVLKITSDVFVVTYASTASKSRIKRKFRKLDVIATFLLVQDLSGNEHFKFDKTFNEKLAAHILKSSDANVGGKSTSGTKIARYYEPWRSKIIEEIGIRTDPKRLFDDADKEAIYARDQGKCQICENEKAVEPDEAEYDHYPVPYAAGGRTNVENGRLVHAACHQRGRLPEDAANA